MRISLPAPALLTALLLASAGGACKSEPPPPQSAENVERTALVAQPCPELELGNEPLDPANARAFVEVVEVSARDIPSPIGRWLEDHAVTIRSSANVVAFPGVPTSAPWAQCVDAVCADTKRSVSVTVQLPERGSDPIDLRLHVEEAAASDVAAPQVLLDATLQVPHQEPVVVPSSAELGGGSLVVTAYLLRRFDDLHRVLECKERQKLRERKL
jgi:hypothetical protein